VGTECGSIWYVNWQEHSSVRLVTTNPSNITAVEFSTDGDKFLTCAEDGSLRLWLTEDREQILQFQVVDQVSHVTHDESFVSRVIHDANNVSCDS